MNLVNYCFDKPTEIDWATDYSVLALNLSTMQFENTSMIGPKSKISLNTNHNNADHSEDIAEMAKKSMLLLFSMILAIGVLVLLKNKSKGTHLSI